MMQAKVGIFLYMLVQTICLLELCAKNGSRAKFGVEVFLMLQQENYPSWRGDSRSRGCWMDLQ